MARNNNNFIHKKTLITENSVSPDAVFNTDDLIAGQGGLTTGGILSIAVGNSQTFINYDSNGATGFNSTTPLNPSPANFGSGDPAGSPSVAASPINVAETETTGVFTNSHSGNTVVTRQPGDFTSIEQYDIITSGPIGPGTPSYQGTIPFVTSSDIRVNLNTGPSANQDLINFFGAGAGADSDQIHTYEIYDEVPANTPGSVTLQDDDGVDVNVKILSTTTFGSPLIPYTDKLNTVDLQYSNPSKGRHFMGMSGLTFATGTPEFVYDPTNFTSTRDTNSRFRFRTRKSTPEEITGGATPTYGLDAPEIPLGKGVSIPVFSNLSPKFVFKVHHKIHSQGSIKGYDLGETDKTSYSFIHDSRARLMASLDGFRHIEGAGHASTSHGYSSGGSNPPVTPNAVAREIISKFPFANDINSETNVGDLTAPRYQNRGISSETDGFSTGGRGVFVIDKFPFSTDNNAVAVGNSFGPGIGPIPLIGEFGPSPGDGTILHQTASGPDKGYMAGGTTVSTMQRFPYTTNTPGSVITSIKGFTAPNNIDPSNFSRFNPSGSNSHRTGTGHNSAIAGYVAEAHAGQIDKWPYATEIISTNIASINPRTSAGGGTSSFNSGYAMGDAPGNNPIVAQHALRKFSFVTDADAVATIDAGSSDDNHRSNVQV